MADAVKLSGLKFHYRAGKPVLDIAGLRIGEGERVFLFGLSGSGKTTLLGILAGVLRATAGSVEVLGHDLMAMSPAERDKFRGGHVGYIFQLFNLIPYLSVVENILLPCRLSAERRRRLGGQPMEAAALRTAERLGIAHLLDEPVTELSVGQQQRVAAARSLIGAPKLVIADEPTSALDHDHRERFIALLFDAAKAAGSTLIFVSHDRSLQPLFDRAIALDEVNRASHVEAAA